MGSGVGSDAGSDAGSEQLDDLRDAVRALAIGARVLERALAESSEMTLPQYRVMAFIASSPERASRLAEMAAVSKPSLSGLLDGLETRTWVQRTDVEGDRRGVTLSLTRSGVAALRNAEKAMATVLSSVLENTDSDRAAVLDGLTAFRRVLLARAFARR